MKKLIALSVLLLSLGAFAFADDAMTMPQGVGRVYIAPTYSFAMSEFDKDGKSQDLPNGDMLHAFNLGFALEYGILPWITAAIQWTPGWTPWSDVTAAALFPLSNFEGDFNTNGVADLFVGAKFQILGDNGPVENDMFRLAVAAGVIVPLPGPDFSKEVPNVMANKDATIASMDRHVFAFGGRFYFDWIINENFFLNLYNETIFYPIEQDGKYDGANLGAAVAQGQPDVKVNYKYRLTFEVEPVYSTDLADGVRLTAGLPVNYRFNPAPEIDGTSDSDYNSHSLYVTPNVGVFLTNTPLPLEFKLQYGIPVWGQNTYARHNITAQIRVYFAIPPLMAN